MADMSQGQLREVVTRVMGDVLQEVKSQEAAFGVGDLRAHLSDLAKVGGESAWTISYSTSSASIDRVKDVAGVGGESAWTISYSTSSAPLDALKGVAKERAR